jgi:hypothetical protein
LAGDWEVDGLGERGAERIRDLLYALHAYARVLGCFPPLNLLCGDAEAVGEALLSDTSRDPSFDDRLGELVERAKGPLLHAAGAHALMRLELVSQHLRLAAESVAGRCVDSRVHIGRRIARFPCRAIDASNFLSHPLVPRRYRRRW